MMELDSLEMLRQHNQSLLQQLKFGQTRFRDLLNESGLSLSNTSVLNGSNMQTASSYRGNHVKPNTGVTVGRHVPTVSAREKLMSYKAPVLSQGNGVANRVQEKDATTGNQPTKAKKYVPIVSGEKDTDGKENGDINGEIFHSDAEKVLETSLDLPTEHTRTSTPLTTPTKPSLRDTPRSILKHRKIIDDNVQVESKYEHTPDASRRGKNGLNFSYSKVDDLDLKTLRNEESERNTVKVTPPPSYMVETGLDGSYLEECEGSAKKKPTSPEKKRDKDVTNAKSKVVKRDENPPRKTDQDDSVAQHIEKMYRKKLLTAAGNDRGNRSVVEELERRPKSVVFESAEQTLAAREGKKRETLGRNDTSKVTSMSRPLTGTEGHSLLGYDWIAGVLDNENSVIEKSDDFYDQIRQFRQTNKEDCINTGPFSSVLNIGRSISPEVQDPQHTCIHGFSVNDRLFVEPLNTGEDGNSVCPICLIPRMEPNQHSPGFVRVSIPRSTLETPYKIKPHRRRSFDPTDSCALSQHCLAGWECSRPAMIPTAANVDLKHATNGIKAQLTSTTTEAEAVAQSYSRSSRLTSAPRSRTTEELLNQSCALRYDLQRLEQGRGLTERIPPNSTRYPAL